DESGANDYGQCAPRRRSLTGETDMKPRLTRMLLLIVILFCFTSPSHYLALPGGAAAVNALDSIGITVSDIDRSVEFFSKVLSFETMSEIEIYGSDYEHLYGLFGMRARIVRMKLGDESIELTEYLTTEGRPMTVDSRSNDRWFQHIAIIVSDMDKAYQWLRQNKVEHASTGPQTLPEWNKNAGGIRAFYFKDPDQHALEILWFPPGKGDAKWHRETQNAKRKRDSAQPPVPEWSSSNIFPLVTAGLTRRMRARTTYFSGRRISFRRMSAMQKEACAPVNLHSSRLALLTSLMEKRGFNGHCPSAIPMDTP